MSEFAMKILEVTFVAVIVYLVATNARGVTEVIRALSSAYVAAVRTLQGR